MSTPEKGKTGEKLPRNLIWEELMISCMMI